MLAEDEKTAHLVQDFLIMQAQLAYAESMGNKPIRKKIEQLNRMAEQLKKNETAMAYLQKYNRWQAMAGEVYQVIQNARAEGMSLSLIHISLRRQRSQTPRRLGLNHVRSRSD